MSSSSSEEEFSDDDLFPPTEGIPALEFEKHFEKIRDVSEVATELDVEFRVCT